MLGGMTREGDTDGVDSDATDQISSGLASEVRSELLENAHEEAGPKIERLNSRCRNYKRQSLPSSS